MSRLFGRGELKLALLHVAADLGPTNGYAIMHALADRVGGSWQPSPGAIYPALIALEDAGLLRGRDEDGTRRYVVTEAGRDLLAAQPGVLDAVAGRARTAPAPRQTVGRVLDGLVAVAPHRDRPLDEEGTRRLEHVFRSVLDEIARLTAKEAL